MPLPVEGTGLGKVKEVRGGRYPTFIVPPFHDQPDLFWIFLSVGFPLKNPQENPI